MIIHFKAAQNLVAEHYERDLARFSTLSRLKTWLQRTLNNTLM